MPRWRFKLIGRFTAVSPDGESVNLPGRKHEALVAYLLLSKRRSVTREELLKLLWGTRSTKQARDSLKSVLYQLNQTLQPHGYDPLGRDRTHVFLTGAEPEVDVWDLQSISRKSSLDTIERSVEPLDADLLETLIIREEEFEDWIDSEKQNLTQLTRAVLTIYAEKLIEQQRHDDAINIGQRMLSFDNTDESAHRLLMQIHYTNGSRALAVQQYQHCVNILRRTLSTTVSAETEKLFTKITSQDPVKDSSTPLISAVPPVAVLRPAKRFDTTEVALAVLPFVGGEGAEWFQQLSLELTEEIVGACARYKWFRVVPSKETARKDLTDKSPSELYQSIAAKYVLSGHFRSSTSRTVLSVELMDVEESNLVWSHKFDIEDKHSISAEIIVPLLASSVDNKLRANEIKIVYRVPEEEYTGYECALRAIANLYDLSDLDNYKVTESLFERAVKTIPNNSWFYSLWSLWKMYSLGQQWVSNVEEEFEKAGHLARQAIKRDADDALAHAINGHFMTFFLRRNDEGRIALDRSLKLNPYSSFALLYSSVNYAYGGRANLALKELDKTTELCSIESHFEFMLDSAHCISNLVTRNPEDAAKWGYATVHENPGFTNGYKQLLVALGHLNDDNACRFYLDKLIGLDPKFEVNSYIANYPLVRESDREYFMEGLVKAGAPIKGNGGQVRLTIV